MVQYQPHLLVLSHNYFDMLIIHVTIHIKRELFLDYTIWSYGGAKCVDSCTIMQFKLLSGMESLILNTFGINQ